MSNVNEIQVLNLPLERDLFLRNLIRHLSGTLQDVIGVEEASGFISIVGQQVGDEINGEYRKALNVTHIDKSLIGAVLVDLKRRIGGDFYIVSEDDEKIVLGNRQCPFEDKVLGRPAMCMMTSNVFGTITAENLGYSQVELTETIANGAAQCRVVVHLQPNDTDAPRPGIEYYRV
ncbi:methanogen output domain 1-containing protein [Salinimonas sediminis]|uniref:methanogen output domain 1-containing protein n=1 Tax=Salinimonas sediminis TaxID=2303538 RepID=UPI001E351EAB|nr:methanogen output domain 1-containing protein [Salinimonas sediminis]